MSIFKLSIEYLGIIPCRQDNNRSSLCFLIPFQDTQLMRELNILINNITTVQCPLCYNLSSAGVQWLYNQLLRRDEKVLAFHITFWNFLGRSVGRKITFPDEILSTLNIPSNQKIQNEPDTIILCVVIYWWLNEALSWKNVKTVWKLLLNHL